MIYAVLAFALLHFLFYLLLSIGWQKIATVSNHDGTHKISVIVPVRNEAKGIAGLLTCLEYQDFDRKDFEVLVVNDFSEDDTIEIVEQLAQKFEMNLRVISLTNPAESGKKHAITKGVNEAKNEFIITTDGDCKMGPHWLSSFAQCLRQGKKFIAGPVALKGNGLFARLQQLEFAGLIGFGAVSLESRIPSMCNGANLGFDKSAFHEVGGYEGNLNIPSGDDEFLLYDIQQKYPTQTTFLKNRSALVVTPTHTSLSGFINQRIRWTSKWKHHQNPRLRLIAITFFLDYLISLIGLVLALSGELPISLFGFLFGLHLVSHLIYLRPLQKFLGHRVDVLSLGLLQIIYPFHVFFMGVTSIFGGYTWKGRKY